MSHELKRTLGTWELTVLVVGSVIGSGIFLVPGPVLGSPSAALTVPLPGSRSRYVFALPQADGLVYLGLTDEPVDAIDSYLRLHLLSARLVQPHGVDLTALTWASTRP